MKVVNIGTQFEIYNDTLNTYDALPAQTYVVCFAKMTGFYLNKFSDIETKEDKVYGEHVSKVEKVLSVFPKFKKNLGVILSGKKGIGKSLFAKMLANKAVENGIPVIIVDKYIPGIASYIESIDQEVMIIFDEFDKTFGGIQPEDGQADPQVELLTLFDGISQGKKLFVITCNELRNLNSFLINRPGRFHYHFRFDYPTAKEIEVYLKDKIEELYYPEIKDVVLFSKRVPLNYDCLRAIAFELNLGTPFKDAIKDLNIINIDIESYIMTAYLTNGETATEEAVIDMFDQTASIYRSFWFNTIPMSIRFKVKDCEFDPLKNMDVILASKTQNNIDTEYLDTEVEKKKAETMKLDYITISRKKDKMLHYLV